MSGQAWQGAARLGAARFGRPGQAGLGSAWFGKAGQGGARLAPFFETRKLTAA